LVWRELSEGVGQPKFQACEVLVSTGQNAGRDEQAAKVACGLVLRQRVQRLVDELALLEGEFGEEFALRPRRSQLRTA
jgi:hypothetical protein